MRGAAGSGAAAGRSAGSVYQVSSCNRIRRQTGGRWPRRAAAGILAGDLGAREAQQDPEAREAQRDPEQLPGVFTR